MSHSRNQCHGSAFTLIEVLIALVVLAIAFTALFETTRSNIKSQLALRNTLISHWVAMNVFSSIEIGLIAKPEPNIPVTGDENMLNKQWHWVASTNAIVIHHKQVQQMIITVYQNQKRYQHLVGFIL